MATLLRRLILCIVHLMPLLIHLIPAQYRFLNRQKITSSSEELYDCVGDNAATVEQVVAGVTLTEEAVEQVGKEIGRISELVSDVGRKVSDGSERSEELIQEVQKMKDTANQSLDANREKMVWNENNIEKAMKELQSLSRINEMVDRILEITSQTNLFL